MGGLPVRLPVGGVLLHQRRGSGRRRHGHGGGPLGQGDGLDTSCRMHRIESRNLRGEHLREGLREVLQQMEAVSDLDGVGRASAGALGIGRRPIDLGQ